MLWFVLLLLLLFFPRLISAAGDWMFTILWHMVDPVVDRVERTDRLGCFVDRLDRLDRLHRLVDDFTT